MYDIGIVDTHAHLCDRVFNMDRSMVLVKARGVGVRHIIAVGEDMFDAKFNLKLARIHPEIIPAAGLSPGKLDLDQADEMVSFIRTNRGKLIGIGEVGLDYWVVKEESEREIQREIFKKFIDLSLELELPLNVHSRSAGKYAIEMLLERGAQKVQLHAFDGKASSAQPAVEAGYLFSIPPSIVRSPQKQKLVKKLPLASILLETDCPVLGANTEERNEPANIGIVIDAVAEIKVTSPDEVTEVTKKNTIQLYGILRAQKQEF